MVEFWAAASEGRGRHRHRQYGYNVEGDLTEVKDALGASWRYDYDGHLLVQETDRTGLSFYFQYDYRGPFANCIRTWGDGGIYDHEISYDKPNRRTVVIDSHHHSTVYEMNTDGLVVEVRDAHGGVTSYEYDPWSFQVTAETDPLGRTTRWSYDELGNLTSVTGPDGATVVVENDPRLNEPIHALDAGGGQWRWEYDSLGHLSSRTLPTGETVRYEWDGGLLRAVEGPGERRTSYTYNDRKDLVGVRLANGAELSYDRDMLGQVTQMTDPRGTTRNAFDLEGRAVETISPTGVVQRMAYDGEGNLVESRDATRHLRLRYGHFHKLVEREEAGTKVRFEYDTEDRLTAVVNESGERYLFERDALGEVKSETGFDGQRRVYFRDAASQVEKVLLPGNVWTHLGYDDAGRVTEVKHFDGTGERYEYGPDGSLIRAANDETEVVFERDALGRVLSERMGDVVVTSRYGPDGARGVVESSLGARQAVLYDALGEVESLHHGPVSDFWRTEQRFGRDSLGAELSRELPGGLQVSWNRDASGKPTARHTLRNQPGARPVELNARGYQWRGDDQIAAIVDAVAGPRWFDHDNRGRLIRERRPGSSPIHGDDVLHRAMDAVGNIFRSPDFSDRRYGPGGRIEEADGACYEHNDLGNLIKKTEPDGSEWRYFWNGAGMLVKVERPDGVHVAFEYDVFARRTRKSLFTEDDSDLVGPRDPRARRMQDFPPWEPKKIIESETRFVWDGHTVLHELSSDEGLTTWYWEPGTFMPVAKERGKHFWSITHDHLGTPTEMYDEQGKLVWQMELDTFGKPTFTVGTATDCPWRWPGQYEDLEIGLIYNRFRYCDVERGGYLSKDPLGPLAGLETYRYAHDPVVWIDPLGLIIVFRNLPPNQSPTTDLTARAPGRGMSPGGHIMNGSRPNFHGSQYMSSTTDPAVVLRWREPGQSTVMIDTDLVEPDAVGNRSIIDVSTPERAAAAGLRGQPYARAVNSREVLIEGLVPPSAMADISEADLRAACS